ncbi:uncharacterized protein, partial [Mycetomoellerius zeteki]|uniref:uncharacterized protein n=1 Tax=Mycetomoellerius zeteki TaxID=64791 RepID=UPI00084EB866
MDANKDVEGADGTEAINEEAADDLVPVRRWIRVHYTKMTRNNEARCIHCDGKFIIYMKNLAILHKHLVEAHADKLTKEEKNDMKFHWTWDYFTRKEDRESTCKLCKARINHNNNQNIVRSLKEHLKSIHKIFGPGSDKHVDNKNISGNVDADRNTTIRNAKYQEDLSIPTGSCNNSYVKTGGTEDLN